MFHFFIYVNMKSGFQSWSVRPSAHEENSSRQPRPAVLVLLMKQTLSLLWQQTSIAQCKSGGMPIGKFENLSDDNHLVQAHHVEDEPSLVQPKNPPHECVIFSSKQEAN